MTALFVLLLLLAIATATDIARHRIYNCTTYPGILAGIVLNAAGLGRLGAGWDGCLASVLGFLACGLIILTAFVFFEIGGGDVKLIAMLGAFLGIEAGLESLLWTFSLGFVLGISIIIWQVGVLRLARGVFQHLVLVVKSRGWIPLNQSERQPLKRGLFLAPSALAATVIVEYPEILRLWGK